MNLEKQGGFSVQGSTRLFFRYLKVLVFGVATAALLGVGSAAVSADSGNLFSLAAGKTFQKVFGPNGGDFGPTSANSMPAFLGNMIENAKKELATDSQFKHVLSPGYSKFVLDQAVGDSFLTTIKFNQTYKGVDVYGEPIAFHYGNDGSSRGVTGSTLDSGVDTEPSLRVEDVVELINDRYQQQIYYTHKPRLQIIRDFRGRPRLVYQFKTRTTATHRGRDLFIDAHEGRFIIEAPRAFHMEENNPYGAHTILSADTPTANRYVDSDGYPTAIDLRWYEKMIEDDYRSQNIDRSASNALRNAAKTYVYYKRRLGRASFDGRDARMTSVVHMGKRMNNAFWTDEYQIMAYGDGDNRLMRDLTYGVDVAAHEFTHAVTKYSADLVYASEPGALNEAFSDFFGKMVDFNGNNDWDIGRTIMAPAFKRRALRNMEHPEEFDQPGDNESSLREPTNTDSCDGWNDYCGVHANSGIPNRFTVLLIKGYDRDGFSFPGVGKLAAEKIMYTALTHYLKPMSNFHDYKVAVTRACNDYINGEDEQNPDKSLVDCNTVDQAFQVVKIR
ncbi:MAG: M4 family metallopeptidase [Bacteriovoracia bacterium]